MFVARTVSLALLILCLALGPPGLARADDGCGAFTWDVSHEHALFASTAARVSAGATPTAAPALQTDSLFQVQLLDAGRVSFAVPPGKAPPPDGQHAGILRLSIGAAGRYRVSLDQAAWIDVIVDGAALRSRDFQGRSGCDAPHKVVEFDLPANAALILQLSGARTAELRIAVTHSPPGS
jgi:hypothetical protein